MATAPGPLGEFLRAQRARITPADVGLVDVGARRVAPEADAELQQIAAAAKAAMAEMRQLLGVLTLMAAGRSDAEIAAALIIAEQTTTSHVSRVLQELHLRDGVPAVV